MGIHVPFRPCAEREWSIVLFGLIDFFGLLNWFNWFAVFILSEGIGAENEYKERG
jgi:hypothetical protein